MSGLDIIALPGHAGMFARRVAVEAWQRAGSPRVNSAGRLYALQKYYWDGWRKRLPGFQPADNPDDETQRLAHVRFVAFDIDATADRIRRLTAAGFVRPYWYEPWHWELPNVRSYGIVRSIPAPAGGDITPIIKPRKKKNMATLYHQQGTSPTLYALAGDSPGTSANWLETTAQGLANAWSEQIGGPSVAVNTATWDLYRANYLAPLRIEGGNTTVPAPTGGASKVDVDAAADRVIAAIPTVDPAAIARAVNDDAAERLRN